MRRQPQQKRAKASVETIIEAGFISLIKHGISNTTTVHIAEIAGISPGTLYQYFANKEEVYAAMQLHFVNDILATVDTIAPELVHMGIRDAIMFVLERLIATLLSNEGRYLKYTRQTLHTFDESMSNSAHEIEKRLKNIIIQYVMHHPELMRIQSIPTLSYLIINGGVLIIIRYLSDPNPSISLEELIEGFGNMAVRYIDGEINNGLAV